MVVKLSRPHAAGNDRGNPRDAGSGDACRNSWLYAANDKAAFRGGFLLPCYWKFVAFCPGVFPDFSSFTIKNFLKNFSKTIDKNEKVCYNIYIR